jgi:hypothetical protein
VGHWSEPCSVEHLELGAPMHCSVEVVGKSVREFLDLWAQDGQIVDLPLALVCLAASCFMAVWQTADFTAALNAPADSSGVVRTSPGGLLGPAWAGQQEAMVGVVAGRGASSTHAAHQHCPPSGLRP